MGQAAVVWSGSHFQTSSQRPLAAWQRRLMRAPGRAEQGLDVTAIQVGQPLVERALREQAAQLGLPGAGPAVGALAPAPHRLAGHHGYAGAVDGRVEGVHRLLGGERHQGAGEDRLRLGPHDRGEPPAAQRATPGPCRGAWSGSPRTSPDGPPAVDARAAMAGVEPEHRVGERAAQAEEGEAR